MGQRARPSPPSRALRYNVASPPKQRPAEAGLCITLSQRKGGNGGKPWFPSVPDRGPRQRGCRGYGGKPDRGAVPDAEPCLPPATGQRTRLTAVLLRAFTVASRKRVPAPRYSARFPSVRTPRPAAGWDGGMVIARLRYYISKKQKPRERGFCNAATAAARRGGYGGDPCGSPLFHHRAQAAGWRDM